MENETSEGFDLHAAADEIIASESDSSQAQTDDSSLEAGQSLEDSQQTPENKELSPEDILNQVGKEQVDPNALKDVLEKINTLGAVHAGQPITVDSPEKLKQLIEMGTGFYAKTEEHANKVKAWEAESQQKEALLKERETQFAQQEEQFQRATLENQIMEDIFLEMQTSDPELFAHISALFQKQHAALERQKPVLSKYEGKLKSLEDELKGLKGEKKTEELSQIKQGWEKELGSVQDKHAGSLSKLGIRPDWEKVKAHWAADATGTMTAEQALYAVHGPDIVKAHQSQLNLLKTKNKVSEKLVHRSGVGNAQRGGEEDLRAEVPGDYMSILRQASEKL
jgi:hypothetical protein